MSYARPIEKRLILAEDDSSFISSVRYVNRHLHVQVGSREYVHKVPRSVFRRMAKAISIGQFYNTVVKRHYPHIEQDPK